MINKQSITIKLYTIADEKGYKADDFETDFAERYIDKTKPENPDAVRYAFLAPTYHQLIDWVFEKINNLIEPKSRLKNYKWKQVEWLEFWYNHLKDCPLKGELIYRLKKWFRHNGIEIHITWVDTLSNLYAYQISSTGNAIRPDSDFIEGYSVAENVAIIEAFKLLKK